MRFDGLDFLYHTVLGRAVLKVLVSPGISRLGGRFLDSSVSKGLIGPFIKKNEIDMAEYAREEYTCFNDFFSRRIGEGKRPMQGEENDLLAPCDGLLTAIPIRQDTVFPVKQTPYTVASLLRDQKLAKQYEDGICLVFRLCVNHYHRYAYPDAGRILAKRFVKGMLHTVRPIALEEYPVFKENAREYMVLETEHFDRVIQMEVGAMLVGKIENYHNRGHRFQRGQEKGRFLYGGSTIILLLKKDIVDLDEKYIEGFNIGEEIPVKMGEKLGTRKSR